MRNHPEPHKLHQRTGRNGTLLALRESALGCNHSCLYHFLLFHMNTRVKISTLLILSVFVLTGCFGKNPGDAINNAASEKKTAPAAQDTASAPNEDLQVRKQEISFDKNAEKIVIADAKSSVTIDPGYPEGFPKDFPVMGVKKIYRNSNVPRYLFFVAENKEVRDIMGYYGSEAKKNAWTKIQTGDEKSVTSGYASYFIPKTNRNLIIKANSQIPQNLADLKLR